MAMNNWQITSFKPAWGATAVGWVYYISQAFANIHFSRSVDDPFRDHMATNDAHYYYFGHDGTFNTANIPQTIKDQLVKAWNDYFTVQ
jgi:hypothetical protein